MAHFWGYASYNTVATFSSASVIFLLLSGGLSISFCFAIFSVQFMYICLDTSELCIFPYVLYTVLFVMLYNKWRNYILQWVCRLNLRGINDDGFGILDFILCAPNFVPEELPNFYQLMVCRGVVWCESQTMRALARANLMFALIFWSRWPFILWHSICSMSHLE